MTILAKGIVLGAEDLEELARYPRVGIDNVFREDDATLSASSEDADHPVELAVDGLTYDGWRSTAGGNQWIAVALTEAATVNYMAVGAHTLAGCGLIPQYHNGTTWVDLDDEFMPADNSPLVFEFTAVSASQFRLLINAAPGVVSVGVINAGQKVVMYRGLPVGWQPPSMNEDVVFSNTMSEGGQILGRHIVRRGVKLTVPTQAVPYTWARDTWMAFVEEAQSYPFFFWWAGMTGYTEIVYGAMDDYSAQFQTVDLISAQFSMSGLNR
jgi:hypothetical protein